MRSSLDALEFIWLIVKTLHFWLIISAIVTATALREGLIEVTVGFGAVFIFLSYLYSKGSFLSIDVYGNNELEQSIRFMRYCVAVMQSQGRQTLLKGDVIKAGRLNRLPGVDGEMPF